jgi:Tfp pilus assembly protein PilZ
MDFVLKDLGRKLGRRAFKRCTVPGAVVSWMLEGQESFPDLRWPLSDISRAGLSFLTNEPPAIGSDVSLQIFLPQSNEGLELHGRVVYCIPRGPRLTYRYRVGVESETLAQLEADNSPQLLKIIEASERKYGKRKRN